MVAGNDEPDVAMMESATIAFPLAEQGKFLNLQDYLDKDTEINMDALVPNITYSAEPGNVIGIGPGPETFVLYYNEDVFKDAGIDPPPADPPNAWTWDQFVDVAKRLTIDKRAATRRRPASIRRTSSSSASTCRLGGALYSNFIYSNGGDFLSADGKTLGLNQPEAVEAIQKMADLINVYHVAPSPLQAKNIPGTNVALQTKKVAMAFDGQWASDGARAVQVQLQRRRDAGHEGAGHDRGRRHVLDLQVDQASAGILGAAEGADRSGSVARHADGWHVDAVA